MDSPSNPIAIITELQPTLWGWLLAVSFFLTLAVVAIVSKGRRWYELACLFVLVYIACLVFGVAVSHWLLDIVLIRVEVITT